MDSRKKRSLTEIQSYARSAASIITMKYIRHRSILSSITTENTPVYKPGPRPSLLLLNYLGTHAKKKKKLPRILEIKQSLHRRTGSYQISKKE